MNRLPHGSAGVWRVTQTIEGAATKLPDYPLLPGDLLSERPDGSYGKFAPGLGIEGIRLTDEQKATLEAVEKKDIPPIEIVGIAEYLNG